MSTRKYQRKWPNLSLKANAIKSALSDGRTTVYVKGRTDRIRPQLRAVGAKWIGVQRAWAMSTDAADELFEKLDTLETERTAAYSYDRR